MNDGAHLGGIFRLDGVGIVPEIDAVDVFIVEPKSGVMRMIDAFAGSLLEWKAASHDGALGGAQRIEDWLFERGRPDVRGEGLAVNGDIHAAGLFVDGDGDSVGGTRAGGSE